MGYNSDFYNVSNDTEQWIRLTDGCYRNCWNCYAPIEKKVYDLPKIERNKVRFLDMNFIYAHNNPINLIKSLRDIKVNNKIVRYTFLCGLDFTLFSYELLRVMKSSRIGRFNNKGNFINGLTIAWDRKYKEVDKFELAIDMIVKAGYMKRNIQVFMLCNGKISFKECVNKLKILKKHRIQIADCWYDNQKRGSVIPKYWTNEECKVFGKLCRSHNIAIIQNMYDSMDCLYEEPA